MDLPAWQCQVSISAVDAGAPTSGTDYAHIGIGGHPLGLCVF
jgi:hypothetical protein